MATDHSTKGDTRHVTRRVGRTPPAADPARPPTREPESTTDLPSWEDLDGRTDPEERFAIFTLCLCTRCSGLGKERTADGRGTAEKCSQCRGEGRERILQATTGTEAGIGVTLAQLARDGNLEDCPNGCLDRQPDCPKCERAGCPTCNGTGIKSTGTWLWRPWLPSTRNVSDAARLVRKQRYS